MSVEEVLASERKLRVKQLLKLRSKNKGDVSVKDFLSEISDQEDETEGEADMFFVNSFPFDDLVLENGESLPVIIFVAGYVAKKCMSNTSCVECCDLVGD